MKSKRVPTHTYGKWVCNKCVFIRTSALKIMLGHIKYDEKYMPELFLTLPEVKNKQNNEFLIIF